MLQISVSASGTARRYRLLTVLSENGAGRLKACLDTETRPTPFVFLITYFLPVRLPITPPTTAPPTVPAVLPSVSTEPATPPTPAPIAVFLSRSDIPLHAPKLSNIVNVAALIVNRCIAFIGITSISYWVGESRIFKICALQLELCFSLLFTSKSPLNDLLLRHYRRRGIQSQLRYGH